MKRHRSWNKKSAAARQLEERKKILERKNLRTGLGGEGNLQAKFKELPVGKTYNNNNVKT